jgi:hypothetical protein
MCGVGSLVYDSGSVVDIKPAGCRSWGCETCGPVRRNRLEILIRLGRPNKFLTLTCRPRPGETPYQRRKKMGEAFPLLMRRIHRKTGVKPEYGVIAEATLKDEPHLHIAMRSKFISQRLLKKWWFELTGAYMVKIIAVHSVKAAAKYLAKYLGKELHKFGTAKRYWFSKGYVLPPVEGERLEKPDPTRCTWSVEYPEEIAWTYQRRGYYLLPEEDRRSTYTLLSPERYKRSFQYLAGRGLPC